MVIIMLCPLLPNVNYMGFSCWLYYPQTLLQVLVVKCTWVHVKKIIEHAISQAMREYKKLMSIM